MQENVCKVNARYIDQGKWANVVVSLMQNDE